DAPKTVKRMSNASQFTKRLFWIVIPFPLKMWRQSTWSKLPGVLRKSWKVTPSIRMFEGAVVEPLAVLICEPFETYWPGPQPAEPPNTETFDALVMNTLPVAVRFRNVTKLAPWFTYQPAVVKLSTSTCEPVLTSPANETAPAGWNTTSGPASFDGSGVTTCAGYDPAATETTAPGKAT